MYAVVVVIILCACVLIGAHVEKFMKNRRRNTRKTMKRIFETKSRILWL